MSAAHARGATAGVLITFEGGEGSGKSTQVERLAEWLAERGREVVVAREPGTTAVGEMTRRILLQTAPDGLAAEAELALFLAARAQLAEEVIRPALEAARIVLLDRYGDSSVAYQGYGRGIEPGRVVELNRWATRGLEPDLTVLIDMPVSDASGRRGRPPDRLERAGTAFHERVRRGYHRIAGEEPERFLVIDGTKSIDDIQQGIRERVEKLLAGRVPQRTESG
ncbi:MAG TPA: dTMP kinase [Gemmatimonadota bacterium]|nr:dTMP kinase [Gemmatimonadota bacterium]